jgi:hypothetical protein
MSQSVRVLPASYLVALGMMQLLLVGVLGFGRRA